MAVRPIPPLAFSKTRKPVLPLLVGWPLPTSQTAGHRRYSKRLQYRAKLAPNVCHNPVGVDPDLSSFTQGRLADSPTLGFEAQSLWDWRDARALTREPRPGVQRRDLWDRLSPRGENSPKAFLRVEPLNRKRNIQHSTFNAQYRRGSRCRLRSGLEVECRMLNVFQVHGEFRHPKWDAHWGHEPKTVHGKGGLLNTKIAD